MQLKWLLEYNSVLLALFSTLFTWGITALDASTIFFFTSTAIKAVKSVDFKDYQEVKSKTHFLETRKNVG